MLVILNIISVSNYRSKRKKERKKETLGFHVKTDERIGMHMTCMHTHILTQKNVYIVRLVVDSVFPI